MLQTPPDQAKHVHLESLARRVAENHAIAHPPQRGPTLLDRLPEQEAALRAAYRHFAAATEAQVVASYAAEWLLDNFYVVEQALREVRQDMPLRYYRQLPQLSTSPWEGYPRVYAVARELIAFCEQRLDIDQVVRFVRAYQQVAPLTVGELWALPTMLRLAVLENLAQAVTHIIKQPYEGEELATARPMPRELTEETVVANCILSLRMLAAQDWSEFFESVSLVEQVLRSDPAGIYARMDFETRDRYRGVVERLALALGRDEEEVAREAVRLAEEAQAATGQSANGRFTGRAAHVGFYLIDEGRSQLETRLGYRPPLRERLSRWLLGHPTLVYLGSIALLTLAVVLALVAYAFRAGGTPAQLIAVALFAVLPVSALTVSLVNWLVAQLVPPRLLPRLDFQEGIPPDCCTMIVIPAMLTHAVEVQSLLEQLELHYLSDSDPHLYFALLADFGDAPQKHMPEDDALIAQAQTGIQALNRKYGQQGIGPFYLFAREREWNPSEGYWMGWERKRGKLAEFNRLLAGQETSFSVRVGHLDVLPTIRYVITLDADTVILRGSARRLIATLAHPLNRAEFDPGTGAVIAGYTVLQPRVEVLPTSAAQSQFARIFSQDSGVDLYTRAVSNVYQDLFGEGIYAGKGIYDVAAFERSLAGRVPENALLSHDLFEGIHGRAGLVTDVVLFEDYPAHHLAHMHRLHRWTRGDWQLLPWLWPRVPCADGGKRRNDLSVIDRWKIVDNMRRSLLAPTLLAFLIAGWLWLPGPALFWTLVALFAMSGPPIVHLVDLLKRAAREGSLAARVQPLWMAVLRWLLSLAFLPYESLITIDAIGATLVRLTLTRRKLLQWTTAAHTVRLFGKETRLGLLWRKMGSTSLLALGLAWLVYLFDHYLGRPAFLVATPLLLVWILSPYLAYWISRPVARKETPLSAEQRRQLRRLARRTWLYFEQFVGPDDRWLPPDHFQEEPLGLVAHRTSPTNIGLYLLSVLAACDLGYVGPLELVLRLRPTLESLGKLECYRGHLLNWYDTRDLKPLPPRYVSTVDSGNLAACLLVLKHGCAELRRAPVLGWRRWQGLLDTLDVLAGIVERLEQPALDPEMIPLLAHLEHIRGQVEARRDEPAIWPALLAELGREGWQELEYHLITLVEAGARSLDADVLRDLRIWSERVAYHLLAMQNEMDVLLPWLLPLSRPPVLFTRPEADPALAAAWRTLAAALPATPPLDEIPGICRTAESCLAPLQALLAGDASSAAAADPAFAEWLQEARDWCAYLSRELSSARLAAESLLIGLQDLSVQAEERFRAMDFRFLFDPQRRVFHIGYNVESETLDDNHYDLLASEARIAGLIAIAKGDVSQSHWLHLARPMTQVNGARALLSWNGTMFEYLMPGLWTRHYPGSLLEQSCRAAVQRQIAYARQKGVPWGISESGYYRFDAGMHYQYRGFGVPGLGFRRGLAEDLVIAPYASLLALSLVPHDVMQNVEQLIKLGMLGRYGFYEAVDYTRSRLPTERKSAIVRSFMVHHQGMILLALDNYLHGESLIRRFHADPCVQSVELLLHEQVPHGLPLEYPHPEEAHPVRRPQPQVVVAPWRVPVDTPMPRVHVLSNGRYRVVITNAGAGYSAWREVALTRWRADTTLDNWGTWVYVQDCESGAIWSASPQPVGGPPQEYGVVFYPHMAAFRCHAHNVSLRMEVTVPPDDDVEIRRVTLSNHDSRPRRLALTSYGEVVLSPQLADERHPAFNKLFIESTYLPEIGGLLFRRRPRSAEEEPIYLVHLLVMEDEEARTGAYENDRARFLGRGRTARFPAALEKPGPLSAYRYPAPVSEAEPAEGQPLHAAVATLDPLMSLGQEIELAPHATVRVAYVTLAARSREEALSLACRYQSWPRVERAFERARSQSELELRRLNFPTPQLDRVAQLLSVLLYPHAALRADPATLAANSRGQSGLWGYAISGDYPILLVRVSSQEELELVRESLQAHTYWRSRGLKIDLVILNERDVGYDQELHGHLYRLLARTGSDAWLNQRGGVFVLRADLMGRAERTLLEVAARAILDGKKGRLAGQVGALRESTAPLPRFVPILPSPDDVESTPPLARPTGLLFDNGLGGFSTDGREYVIYLEPGQHTPAPWINVIANPDFGFVVSESGSGYTWAGNSSENRLTPWRNDAVSDLPGEALYLRDEETAQVWSPTPLPAPGPGPYLIRHGAGYSIFEHHCHGLKQRLRLFVVPDAPVKVLHLRLENTWQRPRRITATFYAEWVLGVARDVTQQYIVPEFALATQALLARNPYNEEFGERVAFVVASKAPHGLTADRTEFLGREGSLARPAALERIGLAGTVQAGLDPCAAYQVHLDLPAGQAQEVFFLLGQGASREETLRLIKRYRDPAQVEAAWRALNAFWDGLLGTVNVRTPDPAMDVLMNRWLLYQTLSCRVWGRSALYQSSGAFGFRDQLQDVMALVHAAPEIAREHILEAARHQFAEGDVLHWWHPPSGRGVRTRCSDDLLWLPFVTAHYVHATGDETILSESVPFLEGEPLKPGEVERYGYYGTGAEVSSLYEHCRRALARGMTAGPHGLPLFGSGDWNDGFNRVGIGGKGESVWLGWFLHATLERFIPICERWGDEKAAALYRQQATALRQVLEEHAWDWGWYRRGYYDDGTPLGSSESDECQIDAIAQSWAVLSGAADPQRATLAMKAVASRLGRRNDGLVLLFTPPFDKTGRDPGYVKGYPPGIRENGAQYTHAAVWVAWAFAKMGDGDRAEALFRLLNPIYHADTAEKVARYRVEPYVVAADVYSMPPHVGRGGWTWYTGSAAWMYRLGLEAILGVRRVGRVLRIAPCIPKHWPGYEVTYRDGATVYHIRVENPDGVNRGVRQITLDGKALSEAEIPLTGDGRRHEVWVVMG